MRAKRTQAFTLIELLIAMSILAILLALGTIGYRDYIRRENVSSVAQQIVSDMRLAQQYALSGYKPAGCNDTLDQFEYRRISVSQYSIVAVCGTDEIMVKTVNLPSGIRLNAFSPSVPGQAIGFEPVTKGTNLTRETVSSVSGNGTSFVQSIRISPSGEISYE